MHLTSKNYQKTSKNGKYSLKNLTFSPYIHDTLEHTGHELEKIDQYLTKNKTLKISQTTREGQSFNFSYT